MRQSASNPRKSFNPAIISKLKDDHNFVYDESQQDEVLGPSDDLPSSVFEEHDEMSQFLNSLGYGYLTA